MELSLVPWMGKSTSCGVFWGVCELSITLGDLSADGGAVFLFSRLFGVRCPVLEPAGSWV